MATEKNTQDLLDGRRATYGDRVVNMEAVADMVNGYMDGVEQRSGKREMTGADFAAAMLLYKVYRFGVTPDYSDNIDDIKGYAQIMEECVGDKMVKADSAKEYQAKKAMKNSKIYQDIQAKKQQTDMLLTRIEEGTPEYNSVAKKLAESSDTGSLRDYLG